MTNKRDEILDQVREETKGPRGAAMQVPGSVLAPSDEPASMHSGTVRGRPAIPEHVREAAREARERVCYSYDVIELRHALLPLLDALAGEGE